MRKIIQKHQHQQFTEKQSEQMPKKKTYQNSRLNARTKKKASKYGDVVGSRHE